MHATFDLGLPSFLALNLDFPENVTDKDYKLCLWLEHIVTAFQLMFNSDSVTWLTNLTGSYSVA